MSAISYEGKDLRVSGQNWGWLNGLTSADRC